MIDRTRMKRMPDGSFAPDLTDDGRELPYEFDLLFDCKTKREVKDLFHNYIQSSRNLQNLKNLIHRYSVKFPELREWMLYGLRRRVKNNVCEPGR